MPVNNIKDEVGGETLALTLADGINESLKATVFDYTNSNPLAVVLRDTNGDYVAVGGGTQYTEGDIDASITGTAMLWEDTSDTLRAVSSAKPLPVNIVAGGAGDGALLDGANSAIKATVFDYTNSNPLAVVLRDTNGDYVAVGGGTQYTEDAAAAADPVGTALNLIRKDTLAAVTDTDGDNVAARGTNKGELYVKHADSIAVTGTFWQATQPISGTITANLGTIADVATETTLAALNAKVTAVNTGAVVVSSSALPTGAATAANQSTLIGHVDGIEGLLTTIDGDTGNIATAVTDLPNVIGTDGAAGPSKVLSIGGTQATGEIQEIQVDADGQLQIDVVSSALPTGAATAARQDTGNTSLATLAGAVAGTEMQVDVLTMPTVTVTATNLDVQSGGADLATSAQGAGIQTAVELLDDAVFTDDTSTHATGTTKGIGIMAVAAPTDASVNANDIAMPAMTTDRKLHVSVQDALPAGTNAIGKLAANSGVDIGDVDITSIAAGDNNIGNVDIVTVPTDPFGANADAASATGSISAKLRGIATALGVTALDLGSGTGGSRTLRVFQDTAQFVGGTGTSTSATQRVTLATDIALPAGTNALGKLLPPDIDVTAHTNYARKYYTNAGAVTDGIIWSPAAGKRWHVVTMYIQTSAAATITLEDDKAGGDDPVWKGELAANSGVTLSFTEKYPMASGEDAADLLITTSAGNVYVTCVGYEV